jgi:hypothetical protein
MPRNDVAWLLPSYALGAIDGLRVGSFLVSFPPYYSICRIRLNYIALG